MRFEQPIPDDPANQWRYQLDQFVQENQQELAGLMWGLLSEWGEDREEVAIVAIGDGQVKLIYFQPDLSPPECFDRLEVDLDTLIQQLESKMLAEIQSFPI